MTIATLAAPQPFFSCFTKGTSSHTPAGSAAKTNPHKHTRIAANLPRLRSMRRLANRNNNQDQRRDGDQDNDQVSIAQRASGEISLGLAAAGSQLCQLLIIEPGYGIFHLLGIDVRGLQRLLGNWGGDEMPNRFNVPLARLGGRNGRTLQFSQADYMALRQRVLWNRTHNC